jgi:predicted neutral ceramidase superfamily lipid hydrolase
MFLNQLTGVLYLLIAAIFAYNFSVILQRIKDGSTKVNKYSLFATSSLVSVFFVQALHDFGFSPAWVLLAQLYLIWTMFYIVHGKKSEQEEKR